MSSADASRQAAELTQADGPLPVVCLSHGAGGNRMVQSLLCLELASQGFIVLSHEHADGSSSATRMAAGINPRWRFFDGLHAERREAQIRFRLEEGRTAARLLQALIAGDSSVTARLTLPHEPVGFAASLRGRIDTRCMACAGHSFGGGPSCALPAEAGSPFACGIAMDPSWPPLAQDHPVFTGFQAPAPVLMVGCQSWNDPAERSVVKTDKAMERRVIAAACRESGGGGSIFLVVRGIGHASFTDADVLYGGLTPAAFRAVPKKDPLPAKLAMALLKQICLNFLLAHLPLSEAQRRRIAVPQARGPAAAAEQAGQPAPGSMAVAAAEAAVYERILGSENIYSLTVTE